MKTIEQKIEQHRKWQKAARERAIARQREKLADPAWRESQYQKMRNTIDRRIAKRGLTLSGTKTHVKQRFLPLTPLLMVSDVLWSPVLPA